MAIILQKILPKILSKNASAYDGFTTARLFDYRYRDQQATLDVVNGIYSQSTPDSTFNSSGLIANSSFLETIGTNTAYYDKDHGLAGTTTVSLTGTKYAGQGGAAWVGVAWTNKGNVNATVTSATSTTLTITGTASLSDVLDFSLAAFANDAAIESLRDAVGDGTTWDVINPTAGTFTLSLLMNEDLDQSTEKRVWDNVNSAGDRFMCRMQSSGVLQFRLDTTGSGGFVNFTPSPAIVSGDRAVFTCTYDTAAGTLTGDLNGQSGQDTGLSGTHGDFDGYIAVCQHATAGTMHVDASIDSITIK